MEISNGFFEIKEVKRDDAGKMRLAGNVLIHAETEVVASPSSQPEDKQPRLNVQLPHMFEVKWILPPRGANSYSAVKAFAESMGYETVEFDDFSYPPSR